MKSARVAGHIIPQPLTRLRNAFQNWKTGVSSHTPQALRLFSSPVVSLKFMGAWAESQRLSAQAQHTLSLAPVTGTILPSV
jgi:hypothetical protein